MNAITESVLLQKFSGSEIMVGGTINSFALYFLLISFFIYF